MIEDVLARLSDPPLDTPPDEARAKLRRELLRPEYNEQNLVQRFFEWVQRQVGKGLDNASEAPPLSTLAAMVLFVGLVVVLGWLLSQARRTARGEGDERPVLTAEVVTADELRARAEAALASGRFSDAVVDGFRALTARQVERGRLSDTPGATAYEVATALGKEFPHLGARVRRSGTLFDAVLYGDRAANREQAAEMLALDDELLVRR